VLIDHRGALRDLHLRNATVLRRWRAYARLAERLVTDSKSTSDSKSKLLEDAVVVGTHSVQGLNYLEFEHPSAAATQRAESTCYLRIIDPSIPDY